MAPEKKEKTRDNMQFSLVSCSQWLPQDDDDDDDGTNWSDGQGRSGS